MENEEYVYYNKGALAMYELQEQVGEQNVNKALKNFLHDWHSFNNPNKPNRYPTTLDLIPYFREVAPDTVQRTITDLLEQVTGIN